MGTSAGCAAFAWVGDLDFALGDNPLGKEGGAVAFFLYVLDPTITAHAQFVTTDVGVAFFSTLYLYCLRNYLRRPHWKNVCLAGLSLGMALGSKFSAVVLIPVSLVLIAISHWNPLSREKGESGMNAPEPSTPAGAKPFLEKVVASILFYLACLFLWLIYFCPRDLRFYLRGIQAVNLDHGKNPYFYLMGELKRGGWVYYLLAAWFVKTPIPTILLMAASIGVFFDRWRTRLLEEAFLWVPCLGYLIFYSVFGDDIGIRYMIPCYPFLFIFASTAGAGGATGGQDRSLRLHPSSILASLRMDHDCTGSPLLL
ncbi:MAG: phospholipid carrier-dependent glycosyltransferase [Terriglobia bacterium]